MSTPLAWTGVGIGVFLALVAVVIAFSPRLQSARPLLVLVLAGMMAGIVVAFLPIVLAIPISPAYFAHVTWFPSWI